MLRKPSEFKREIIENQKGGKGYIEVVNFFETEDFLGKGRLFGKTIIKPGNSIGYHAHEGDQEAYYILKGQALYNDNGKERVLGPGDLVICRDGESHSIECIGEEDLEFIMLILYN